MNIKFKIDRDIPAAGGSLHVNNGSVYVDQTQDSCGIIASLPNRNAQKVAGDLVMISLH